MLSYLSSFGANEGKAYVSEEIVVSRGGFCVGLCALVRGTVNIDLIVTNETV